MIKELKDKYLSLWWETSTEYEIKDKVSLREKLKNEKRVEKFRKNLFTILKQVPEDIVNQEIWRNEIFNQIKLMESNLSNYDVSLIEFFVKNNYGSVTDAFIKKVSLFDPNMDVYDIFQAIRNVWIMNSIQILYDMEVKITPSIFAYSMLYPYSDNYLDDASITFKEKVEFNNRFRRWLLGERDNPLNPMEEHILNLVKMIEGEFDRKDYPEVFESLLAIHKAQGQSLLQQRQITLPYEKDIIGISFEKGGTSVLADAYLVRGSLSEIEASFMFSYGVLLQIIDDLQDVEEDYNNNHMTIFSQLENKYSLDRLVNKLMNFINGIFNTESYYNPEKANTLKKVIKDCSYIMILEAISKNKKRFSSEYFRAVESSSIVRFSYLKKVKKKFQQNFSSEDIIKICSILAKSKLEQPS